MFGKHCLSLPFLSNKTESNLRSSLPNVWNCAHSLDGSDDWQQKGQTDYLRLCPHDGESPHYMCLATQARGGSHLCQYHKMQVILFILTALFGALLAEQKSCSSCERSALKASFCDLNAWWMAHHVFLVPSVSIFYSHTVLLHFKSLYVCAPRRGSSVPDLVKFRWNDRAREGGVRILYVYRFRWFSLFMFFKHSAA